MDEVQVSPDLPQQQSAPQQGQERSDFMSSMQQQLGLAHGHTQQQAGQAASALSPRISSHEMQQNAYVQQQQRQQAHLLQQQQQQQLHLSGRPPTARSAKP